MQLRILRSVLAQQAATRRVACVYNSPSKRRIHLVAAATADVDGNVAAARLISSTTLDGTQDGPRMPPGPPYVIGVCGGTASGKTSVCNKIIEGLVDISMVRHQYRAAAA